MSTLQDLWPQKNYNYKSADNQIIIIIPPVLFLLLIKLTGMCCEKLTNTIELFVLGWSIFHNLHIYYQNSKFEIWFLHFASYLYLFNAKIKKIDSAAAAAEIRFLNFASYHNLFNTKTRNSKFGRGSGRILDFEFW